jgi:hypothetical protein
LISYLRKGTNSSRIAWVSIRSIHIVTFRYIAKENELLDRNSKHCESRDQWYREEVNKSWGIAVSNRNLILRSVARTNVLKKDISEWLERIEEGGSMAEHEH